MILLQCCINWDIDFVSSPRQTTKWYDDLDQSPSSVRIEECSEGSLASNSASSGCGSLPRKDRPNIITGIEPKSGYLCIAKLHGT